MPSGSAGGLAFGMVVLGILLGVVATIYIKGQDTGRGMQKDLSKCVCQDPDDKFLYSALLPAHAQPVIKIKRYYSSTLTRPAKSRNHAISDWGHKDTPGDTFWLAGIYFLGLVTF